MSTFKKVFYFIVSFATLILAFYIPAWFKPFFWLLRELALWVMEKM